MHDKAISPPGGSPRRDSPGVAARKNRNKMKGILPASAKKQDGEGDESEEIDDEDDEDGGVKIQEQSREVDRSVATKQEWIPLWLSKQEQEYEEMVKWNTTDDNDDKANKSTEVANAEGKKKVHGHGNGTGQQR